MLKCGTFCNHENAWVNSHSQPMHFQGYEKKIEHTTYIEFGTETISKKSQEGA